MSVCARTRTDVTATNILLPSASIAMAELGPESNKFEREYTAGVALPRILAGAAITYDKGKMGFSQESGYLNCMLNKTMVTTGCRL